MVYTRRLVCNGVVVSSKIDSSKETIPRGSSDQVLFVRLSRAQKPHALALDGNAGPADQTRKIYSCNW